MYGTKIVKYFFLWRLSCCIIVLVLLETVSNKLKTVSYSWIL